MKETRQGEMGATRQRRGAQTAKRQGSTAWFFLVCWLLLLAPGAAREYPPAVPAPQPVRLPLPVVRPLSNGLRVVAVERRSLPLLTLRLVFKAGAAADPKDLPGLASLTSAVLPEGTLRRDAHTIATEVDAAGGMLDTATDWDKSVLVLSVPSQYAELAFDLLADIAIHPVFAPAEVERQRQQTLSALEVVRADPAYVADNVFRQVIFSGTAYGHPSDGYPEAVRRMTPQDLRRFHAAHYQPAAAVLAVVGDIAAEEAFQRAERFFGNWEGKSDAGPQDARVKPPRPFVDRQVLVVDKLDAVQTEIRIGNLSVGRDNPDYEALSLANQILGGPAANRLFRALRTQRGLTYGASSELITHRETGVWMAKTSTRTPETIKAVRLALDQMTLLHDHALSEDELQSAQSYLIGHRAVEFETPEARAGESSDLILQGLPLEYWNEFPQKVRGLGGDEVWRATRRYLDPETNVIVLVGNATAFKKDLKKLGRVRVISLQELNLNPCRIERRDAAEGN
jgi:zinc protease